MLKNKETEAVAKFSFATASVFLPQDQTFIYKALAELGSDVGFGRRCRRLCAGICR